MRADDRLPLGVRHGPPERADEENAGQRRGRRDRGENTLELSASSAFERRCLFADSVAGTGSERGARLRVLTRPPQDHFSEEALTVLQAASYTVDDRSDRMGLRLRGATIAYSHSADMISDATPMGTLQVPPSGLPILLMADRQTTGGYPQVATVITADLGLAGQLAPGDSVSFTVCSRAEAIAALIAAERILLNIEGRADERTTR